MTKHESDILLALADRTFSNQRELASYTGYALGAVNKAMHSLIVNGYIDFSTARYISDEEGVPDRDQAFIRK